jgi:hypothetical protein
VTISNLTPTAFSLAVAFLALASKEAQLDER